MITKHFFNKQMLVGRTMGCHYQQMNTRLSNTTNTVHRSDSIRSTMEHACLTRSVPLMTKQIMITIMIISSKVLQVMVFMTRCDGKEVHGRYVARIQSDLCMLAKIESIN